jgi:hypothetical protein
VLAQQREHLVALLLALLGLALDALAEEALAPWMRWPRKRLLPAWCMSWRKL